MFSGYSTNSKLGIVIAITLALTIAITYLSPPDECYADSPALTSTNMAAKTDISAAKVSKIPTKHVTGKPIKPHITVSMGGTELIEDVDYAVKYRSNVKPGTASVTVKGIGTYTGAKRATFRIAAKYVFIGDSYSNRSANSFRAWPKLVAAKLGLSKKQYRQFRRSGSGFSCRSKFYNMIINEKVDKKVTDVLIVGGTGNDLTRGKKTISHDYARTIKLVHKKWPNARIMHASPNWHLRNRWYQRTMGTHLPWYRKLAKEYGVAYLPSCEPVLHGHRDFMFGDANHPNQKGQKAIAAALVKDIRKLDATIG